MTNINFAKRAYDHQYNIDPIVRSLLDTDFYKLAMLQLIWKKFRDLPVQFRTKNRTADVKLANIIDLNELNLQLDHVRNLKFTRGEITWIRGNTFYGRKNIFEPEFVDWLENKFKLSSYKIRTTMDKQVEITFSGTWPEVTMWEIYGLEIINTLRNRELMRSLSQFQLDVMFARAKSKLWDKIIKLKTQPNLKLADFGTRRRFDFLWQEWVVTALKEGLGLSFTGTSNMLLAMRHNLEPIGTNAHELPMVYAALAETDDELVQAPYKVLKDWAELYDGNMLVVLPDTFGTTSFLKNAPEWVKNWRGFRLDSKDNFEGAKELVEWWRSKGEDPTTHLIIHSDGLDVGTRNSSDILEIQRTFEGQYQIGFGWGTKATNDFVGCVPEKSDDYLKPISLVCKVDTVGNFKPTVKLSDNWGKAIGPKDEIERYKRVFGEEGHSEHKVEV